MNKYYVYRHVDPDTNEIVYVGYGSGGRAWQCGSSHGPLRSTEHKNWADSLLERGITPDEWTQILDSGLSKSEAREIEILFIHDLKPKFNKSIRYSALKFTPELYDKALKLRQDGASFNTISSILKLSPMTIHRGLSGKSISLETALAERP